MKTIDCLVNKTVALKHPTDKAKVDNSVSSDNAKAYHGRKSKNWKPEKFTLQAVIGTLNAGYSIVPGKFDVPPGESQRSAKYCEYREIILWDADEWNEEHPPPKDLSDFLSRYPTVADDFYWVGESISSRSEKKPEFRGRLMTVLPEPIRKGQDSLWETLIDSVVDQYPFIARGVGIDQVRVSFGNARPECENRILGGELNAFDWDTTKLIAKSREKQKAEAEAEREQQRKAQEAERAKKTRHQKQLNEAGIATPSAKMKCPLVAFCDIPASTLLAKYGLATQLRDNEWHWHESGPGRSFEMDNDVIKAFSHSIKAHNPNTDANLPVQAHRLILSALHGLDISNTEHQCELRCKLADEGYGTHTDLFAEARSQERTAGIKKGIIAPNAREIKLTESDILTDIKRETLEVAENFIQKVLNSDLSGQAFALRVDTGTGKSEKAILIKGARPILLVGSHDLGTEIYARARGKQVNAFLYRGLMHQADGNFPDESPCIKPTVLEQYRKKGANAFRWGCEGCEVRSICEQQGMRWQHEQLSDPDRLIILAIPQLFIDPRYKSFIKNRLNLTNDDILLVDDASTEGLFLDESITLEFLSEKIKAWKGAALGDFAKAVKDIITENEALSLITQLQILVESTLKNAPRRNTLYRQLKKSRHYDPHTKNFIELSIDDAIEKGYCDTKTVEDRQRLQTVEKEGWTTLDRLRIFFKAYPNPETAPMRYDKTTYTLQFSLPPQLYQTDAAIGFMGATLDLDVFQSVFAKGTRYFKEPQVFDAASTEYHLDSKRYQLRNNRNPRATLLKYQGDGELSTTGLEFFGYFKKFVKANPGQKHALITYKSVIEHYKAELGSLDVEYSWYHNTEGLDTRFADTEVFHVFGMPARNPIDVEWTAKAWGISEDEVGNRLITQELKQAIGRARLVRKPNTVILYTSHKVDGFTERCDLTDEHDWQAAEFQLSQLPTVISERQSAEQAHQEVVDAAIESGDVQAVMEATGKCKRTAEYLTQDSRPQKKVAQDAERNAEIIRILQSDPDISVRQITDKLKALGHKRTHHSNISEIVEQNRRAENANDNYNVNCPLRFSRGKENTGTRAVLSEVDAFFNRDGALHTPEEIAEAIGAQLCAVRDACQELYMAVKISQGHGETYWRGQSKRTASEMTAEQTAAFLLAGKHVDGTPIIEREPQTTADISTLPPHLQVLCEPIEIPKHLHPLWETIEIPKRLQKYHSRHERFSTQEMLQAYQHEANRMFAKGKPPQDIARTLHVPVLSVCHWIGATPF